MQKFDKNKDGRIEMSEVRRKHVHPHIYTLKVFVLQYFHGFTLITDIKTRDKFIFLLGVQWFNHVIRNSKRLALFWTVLGGNANIVEKGKLWPEHMCCKLSARTKNINYIFGQNFPSLKKVAIQQGAIHFPGSQMVFTVTTIKPKPLLVPFLQILQTTNT